MFTNKLFDELKSGDEVVVRNANGTKYTKGKVIKTTKTQLTAEIFAEGFEVARTVRFSKSNGDEIGGKRHIAKHYGYWDDESGKYIPERLWTYAEADEAIEARKVEEAAKLQKSQERQEAAKTEFASVVEKTNEDRKSLTLIDSYNGVDTYKVVVTSELGVRTLGVIKIQSKEYIDWEERGEVKGFEFGLVINNDRGGWSMYNSETVKTFEAAIDQVMYKMYKNW